MGIKIVVVDDDRITLALLEKALIMKGFWVYSAGDGEKGFELVKEEKPSLVISDMLMPKMHGFDLCKKIKSSDEYKGTKVILMTAVYKDNLAIKKEARDSGAEDVVSKPLNMELLVKTIYKILDIKQKDLKSKNDDFDPHH